MKNDISVFISTKFLLICTFDQIRETKRLFKKNDDFRLKVMFPLSLEIQTERLISKVIISCFATFVLSLNVYIKCVKLGVDMRV